MIKSVWGLTSGGAEKVIAKLFKEHKKHLSVFTKALINSLNPENKSSIFKNGKISDLTILYDDVKKNMNFENLDNGHVVGCGPLTGVSSSNFSEKGIPIFASSLEALTISSSKIKISKKKKLTELLKPAPYSLYRLVPLKNISLDDLQIELKRNFSELRTLSIDDQNEERKGKLLSQSYIENKILIFKEENQKTKNEDNSFDENKNQQFNEYHEYIELKDFWDKNKNKNTEKIILYGRAGIGKVK